MTTLFLRLFPYIQGNSQLSTIEMVAASSAKHVLFPPISSHNSTANDTVIGRALVIQSANWLVQIKNSTYHVCES